MYSFGLARWRLLRTLEMHTTSISLLARARFTFTINDAALSNDHGLWSALHGRRGVVDPVRPGIASVLLLNLLQLFKCQDCVRTRPETRVFKISQRMWMLS